MNQLTILLSEYRKKGNILHSLTAAKKNLTINEFVKLTCNPSLTKLKEEIWGNNIFPGKWDINNKPFTTYFTDDLIVELKYLIAACIAYNDELLQYGVKKEKYEQLVLEGDYAHANIILDEIEKQFGESLWLINSKFFLAEKNGGTEENWKLLADLTRERNDSLIRLLIENKSRLNETKIRYNDYLKTTLNRINSFPVNKGMKMFLGFESNVDFPAKRRSLALCTFAYSLMPVIDRYNGFHSLIKLFYCNLTRDDFKDILYQLRHFNKSFPNDTLIRNILLIEDNKSVSENFVDFYYLNLLDKMYQGENIDAKDFIKNRILSNLSFKNYIDFQAYFYKQEIPLKKETLHYEIIKLVQKVNSKDADFVESVLALKKLSVQLSSFKAVTYLEYFIDRENSLNDSFSLNELRMIIDEPQISIDSILAVKCKDLSRLRDEISEKARAFPKLVSTLAAIDSGDVQYIEKVKNNNIELEFVYARCLSRLNEFEAAIKSYKAVMASDSDYFRSFAIIELIASYLELKLYKDLVILLGQTIIETPYLLYRVDVEKLSDMLIELDDPDVNTCIYTPILFSHANADAHNEYMALDNYLISVSATKPSELIGKSIPEGESVLLHLLEKVCVVDVLKYFSDFTAIKEVEVERLEILKFLSSKETVVRESIVSEIIELSQRDVIRRGLSNYNKGKFSLNTFQFRKYLVEQISQSYNRLKLQADFSSTSDFQSVDYDENFQVEVDLQSLGKINALVSLKDPAFVSFKSIFNEIRDLFLFSKEYGLDGILSTRIRHGVLTNHIKKVFLSSNLMSTKESDQYQDVKYWHKVLPIDFSAMEELQMELKRFSQVIDNYCNILRLEFIQIKTEKDTDKSNALFDYSLGKEFYLKAFALIQKNNLPLSEFVGFVHLTLIGNTKWLLDIIRGVLTDKVNSDLRIHIDTLRTSLQSIFLDQPVPELFSNVNHAATNITNELNLISSWFQITEEDDNFKLTQKEIIQVAIGLSNILHPYYQLDPEIVEINPIKLIYSSGFIDLLKILLDNIIIHSKCETNKLDLQITSTLDEGMKVLSIKMEHNLGAAVNIINLENTLNQCKDNWDSLDFYGDRISQEGGSGLRKIKRIIQYELEISNNSFDFHIINNRLSIEIGIELTYIHDEDNYTGG